MRGRECDSRVSTESIAPFPPARKPSRIISRLGRRGVGRSRSTTSSFSLRRRCRARVRYISQRRENSKLPRCVSAQPLEVPRSRPSASSLLTGRQRGRRFPDDHTAFARSVRPSHGTAGRASIIRRTGGSPQIPQHLGVSLYPRRNGRRAEYEGRTTTSRRRNSCERGKRTRRYRARNDQRASELRVRSPVSLTPLSGLRMEREKRTVGLSRDPPPPLPAWWPLPLPACPPPLSLPPGNPRATFPLPRRPHH